MLVYSLDSAVYFTSFQFICVCAFQLCSPNITWHNEWPNLSALQTVLQKSTKHKSLESLLHSVLKKYDRKENIFLEHKHTPKTTNSYESPVTNHLSSVIIHHWPLRLNFIRYNTSMKNSHPNINFNIESGQYNTISPKLHRHARYKAWLAKFSLWSIKWTR